MAAAVALSDRTPYPGASALLPVAGAMLVIAGGPATLLQRSAALRALGDLSYAWYLWHWPVLMLMTEAWPTLDRHLLGALGVALSLGLARLTHRFVENPLRRHPALSTRPLRSYGLALASAAISLATVGTTWWAAGRAAGSELAQRMERASRDRPRLYDDRCFAAALDTEPRDCVYGSADAGRTVVLVGDSHAAQWFPALESLALARGWRLIVFVKAGCPFATVEIFDPKLNRPYAECTQWRNAALQRIERLQPTLLFAANASFYEPFVRNEPAEVERWRHGLNSSLDRLDRAVEHVVLIRDTPRPGFHVPRCLARGGGPAACRYPLAGSSAIGAFVLERGVAEGRPRISVLDMQDSICGSATCDVERRGLVLYHDSQHLSASFARSLAQPLWQRLPDDVRAALSRRP